MTEEARPLVGVPADEVPFDRTQEEDHDLLTFGEAGLRLREALADLRARAAELRSSGASELDLAAVERRLSAMEKAAERNRAQPINDENFEKFFGYAGRPRRNTSW
ncbi:acyl-CoA synthase [Janibacter sp. G1551]|uniref:acyl-CoA synthase n=1 Tax=Janibacter sp. G1551 TaxID=3420440 RepID=UPI003D0306EB